jgi:UDP-N-acetylglucosamine:LPS N-acetylglucosamine transferase
MLSDSSILKKKDTFIIFSYVPVGFGHLRVSDALYHSVEKDTNHVFLSTENSSITFFHRITSVHPIARAIFEWTQNGKPEDLFTYLYRGLLRRTTSELKERFVSVIKQSKNSVKTVVIVVTHFSMAHQIGYIRDEIEKATNVKIYLFLQVTDDSPQHMWYVPNVDITFVPSSFTKNELINYGKKAGFNKIKIKVLPYPISETLTKSLSDEKFSNKLLQYERDSNENIKILIPISGAAVGMNYFSKFAVSISKYSERIRLHILLKDSLYTQMFIASLKKYKNISLSYFKKDTKVIDEYEQKYKKITFGYEITKPSEQAFKSLIGIKSMGGPILLFTNPVGRQEYDNLNFLRRHNLIPSSDDQKILWNAFRNKLKVDKVLLKKASSWRGIKLYKDPEKSVHFFFWCLENNIFREMGKYRVNYQMKNLYKKEIGSNGVGRFWEEVEEYIQNKEKA